MPPRLAASGLVVILLLFVFFSLRTLVVAGGATLWIRLSPRARQRRVYLRDIPEGQLRSELKAAVWVLALDALAIGLSLHQGWIHLGDMTFARTAATFLVMFVWFELWFYATHRLMHLRPFFFLHRQHHVALVVDPLASMSFGLLERGVLLGGGLGFAVLVSRWVPLSRAGLALYFFTNYVLNVLAHTNVEPLPAGYPRHWLARLLNSSTFHAMHHARSLGHYGLFTPWLDRLCETAFPDYAEVHARAASGQGLRTLGERVVPPR
jgi:sterol desaturase/sphingolipid hydroxylase (fatty acid hydroxylase superfamily)